MKIPILYEDENILVVNKPADLMVHSDGRSSDATLVDWIVKKYPKTKGVGEPYHLEDGTVMDRPGIVHRLDRDTTGALVIAKNQAAFQHLKQQFQNHTIKKAYRAFTYGDLKEPRGVIDLPIGRNKNDFRKWTAQRGKRGEERDAITSFTTIKASPEVSFVEARPQTGRTHQIRVHFKAIHHPVVGDQLYAEGKPFLLGFKRHALHAYRLEFKNLEGETISIEAPYPEDFVKAMKKFKVS